MKKKLLLPAISVLFLSVAVQAQTHLKWNALYWAAGVVNMSAETRLSDKWTLNGDLVYSPWESLDGNPMKFGQAIAEGRFYPKGVFDGFYVGVYGAYHKMIKFTKWNYINKDNWQKGNGMSFGTTLGYRFKISDRWGLDMYAGYGWQHSSYKGFKKSTGEMYVDTNYSGEWLPYKAGVAFTYRLGE
jgi:hypothetical protein